MTVIAAPFKRAHLGALAEEIRQAIYRQASRMSVAEVLGVLEIVKQEIYENQRDEHLKEPTP